MSGRNKWSHTVSAFAIGLGAGAAIGLLFAPKSGEETRDSIVDGANEGIGTVISRGQRFVRRAEKIVNHAKGIVEDASSVGQHAYDEAKRA